MSSIQFKIWRYIFKKKFPNRSNDPNIDIDKTREFESPYPPKSLKKKYSVETKIINGRNAFVINPKIIKNAKKVIIYLHGGAFLYEITIPHWYYVCNISKKLGIKIVLPNYPVAPESTFIETINFTTEVYKHVLKEYKPTEIDIIGDSCGGGLAATLSVDLKEKGFPQPNKIILLSPWLDLSMTNPEIKKLEKNEIVLSTQRLIKAAKMYAGNIDVKDPRVSPIYGNLKQLPKTYIFIGTHDILHADSKKFYELAKIEGVNIKYYEYKKMVHCWMIFPIPEAKRVLEEIKKIINE